MGIRSRIRGALDRRALRGAASEAKSDATGDAPAGAANVQRVGYEYGAGMAPSNARSAAAYSQERLQILNQLHQAYLTCPWVSAPVDLIARTVTAGGLQVVADDGEADKATPDPPEVQRLKRLLRFTNPREDMVQLLRSAVIDLNLFGDAFIEVVELLGEPVALYTLDATTMTVVADDHGEITGYVQQVDGGGGTRTAEFTVDQVIHISLDSPRGGSYGVGPAQKALLPVTAWLFTEATIKECFRRGDPPRLHVDLAHSQDTEVQRWREQYMVHNLGPKAVGTPVITTGGGIVGVLDPRKVVDYLDASRQLRDEIISCFGVPPSKLGIIETGNLGGGTGESQDKTLRVNTVIPVANLLLEKVNFRLLRGFNITDRHLELGEIDYRDSKVVEDIRDTRIRNGMYTLNRSRDEIGEPPVEGGGEPILVDRQNLVLWRDMDSMSKAGVAFKLKGTALEPGEVADGEPVTLTKPGAADTARDPEDGPGLAKDAIQGAPPRESSRPGRDLGAEARRVERAWEAAYRMRRRQALDELPPVPADA
ncbi:MAG TPA: phage portal protein [Polyangia bacterium]|nr:phage portal protein [Polyangia bacterium]